jgi:TPR repeat protein
MPRLLLHATIAITFIPFSDCIRAQQCRMAHDANALKALKDRASAGDADAQCGLGRQYESGLGVPQNNQQAALWLQKSAEQGNIVAEVELGIVFDKTQDYAQALIWYRKAAEQGNARAAYNLGLAYGNGESVPRDLAQANAWFRKAADQGDALAQTNLAVDYEHGIGVPQDDRQAADWYRKAADQGLAEAQYGLGFLYLHGNGVPKDEAEAAKWMLKAAEQGETKAQFNLGACYANGVGVNRDLNEGYFWILLTKSRTTDSDLKAQAESTLDALNKVMSKGDIKRAQKRAQAWLNEHPRPLMPEPSGVPE